MRTTVMIDVTQDDIKAGTKYSARFCPVALAIRRMVSFGEVVVDEDAVDFIGTNGVVIESSPLAYAATDFVHAFDLNHEVHPFGFSLDLPAQVVKGAANG